MSQTLKDLHLEYSQLLKRAIHLAASFDGCRLSSLSPYFSRSYQHLQPVGLGPFQGQLAGPAVWSPGLQASARAEVPPASAVGCGDEGWVSAGGWSPEDLSFPLASVRVGVCTRMYSQNKSVPVWEISVKSVFCKSWPGSCFHITNQKQLAVSLGASAFPNQCMTLSLALEKGRTRFRAIFTKKTPSMEVCWYFIPVWWSWASCDSVASMRLQCKGRKNPCWGMGTNLQKGFCSPDAYKKGASTDTLDLAVSLPLSLCKLYLLQCPRCFKQGGVFLPRSA